MPVAPVSPVSIYRHNQAEGTANECPDLLATEEPLEIRLGHGPAHQRTQRSLAVTMRTPGHDLELALGFLFAEGIVQHPNQIQSIRHCTDLGRQAVAGNIVRVELRADVAVTLTTLDRNFYMTSSCGVCGKASIEAIRVAGCPVLPRSPLPALNPDVIHALPGTLRQAQRVFAHTGGLHAAGLFSRTGELLLLREDVGRHNALDKLVGAALSHPDLAQQLPNHLLLVSGRLSFELVQKTIMAGVPVLVAVGAPSSLAVQTAAEFGLTLLGFARNGQFNSYSGHERIAAATQPPGGVVKAHHA